MKKLFYFFAAFIFLSGCQRKQFFLSSSEINIIKKAHDAYFKGDWESFKSVFDEKARIWVNAPRLKDTKILPERLIDSLKAGLMNYTEYKIGKNPNYEDPGYSMIVDDEGEKWVHSWITWLGKTTSGQEVIVPVFTVSHFKENKINIQFIYFNALPGYLVKQDELLQK